MGPIQRRMSPSQTMMGPMRPRYVPPGGQPLFNPVSLDTKTEPAVRVATPASLSSATMSQPEKRVRRKRSLFGRNAKKKKEKKPNPKKAKKQQKAKKKQKPAKKGKAGKKQKASKTKKADKKKASKTKKADKKKADKKKEDKESTTKKAKIPKNPLIQAKKGKADKEKAEKVKQALIAKAKAAEAKKAKTGKKDHPTEEIKRQQLTKGKRIDFTSFYFQVVTSERSHFNRLCSQLCQLHQIGFSLVHFHSMKS